MDNSEIKSTPPSNPVTSVKTPAPQVTKKAAAPKTLAITSPKALPASAKPATKAEPKVKAEKPVKEKKAKLVRDSFTIPKTEYGVLADMKLRAGKLSRQVKKSELIRAGIKALAAMPDSAFLAALKAVPAIKTGRPSKG